MAENGGGGGMMMIMIMIGIAVVAFFLMSRKGQTQQGPSTTLPSSASNVAPNVATSLSPGPTFQTLQTSIDLSQGQLINPYTGEKVALPIISGSIKTSDPFKFDESAAGACQCNESTCCFYSPFFEQFKFNSQVSNETRQCSNILFGDSVSACNQAVSGFNFNYQAEIKSSFAKALAARDTARHYSLRPSKAYKAVVLMANRAARLHS